MPKDKPTRLTLIDEDIVTSRRMTRRSLLAGAGVAIGGAAFSSRATLAADSGDKGEKAERDQGDKGDQASERIEHYEGKPSRTLEDAVENLRTHNKQLDTRLSQELNVENMDAIHHLSYTLENALERINTELETIAENLEGMHLSSEQLDRKAVKKYGRAYLDGIRPLIQMP